MSFTLHNKKSQCDNKINNKCLLSIILLLVVIGIIIARRPELLTSPRFWAEEGEVYFSAAYHSGFWRALFLQHLGYYDIVPNVATALATRISLEHAPFITTYIAFIFQALVSSVVIFGDSPFWDTWPKKLLIACGVQLITPFELWLTTISLHFWLCIATFFILLENPYSSLTRRYFHRGILVIAGLSSVLSIFLTPCFILKAWRDGFRESWFQAGILASTGAIQVCALVNYLLIGESLGNRLGGNQFSLPLAISYHTYLPFYDPLITGLFPEVILVSIFICNGIFFLYLFINCLRDSKYLIIFLSFLLVASLSTVLSLDMASGPRYAFAPSFMLLVILVSEAFKEQTTLSRCLAIVCVIITSLSCFTGFRSRIYYSTEYPRWREEVNSWRVDSGRPLIIWPVDKGKTWRINLASKIAK